MAEVKQKFGSWTAMTVTNLQSLSNSATAGWQSDMVSNLTTLALDYEVSIKLTTANTAPANDKAVYVYVYGVGNDDSTNNYISDGGTATMPSGSEGTYTIANPNNLILAKVLAYTTAQQNIQSGGFFISQCFGGHIPDKWGIILVNYTGAALSTTCIVAYRAYTEQIA